MPHEKIIDHLLKAESALRSSDVSETPRLDAEVLLADTLGIERSRLIASYTDCLGPNVVEKFRERLERRLRGEPVSYIIGRREFMGLTFAVDPRVLIPRAETETLVEYVIKLAREGEVHRVLDVGTGSGCIAVSLAVFLPDTEIHATDVSVGALAVARLNAERHEVFHRINFYEGRYYEALPGNLKQSFQVIVSNPPYVPDSEYALLQRNVREYEPAGALKGGFDGLEHYRKVVSGAPQWLAKGGTIAVEIGVGQAGPCAQILQEAGIEFVEFVPDLAGRQRVITGRRRI